MLVEKGHLSYEISSNGLIGGLHAYECIDDTLEDTTT